MSNVTPQMAALWEEAKRNVSALSECAEHRFVPFGEPWYRDGETALYREWRCVNCTGKVDDHVRRWYEKGRAHEAYQQSQWRSRFETVVAEERAKNVELQAALQDGIGRYDQLMQEMEKLRAVTPEKIERMCRAASLVTQKAWPTPSPVETERVRRVMRAAMNAVLQEES